MLPAEFIPISNSPLSGKKRAVEWSNFIYDKTSQRTSLVLSVHFYEADANEADGYGKEISAMEIHSYILQLDATNNTLVNPANGVHVHKVVDSPEVPSSTAEDGTVILATPEVSHFEDALKNTVATPVGEFDFFTGLMHAPVVVEDIIAGVIQSNDALYHKFDN